MHLNKLIHYLVLKTNRGGIAPIAPSLGSATASKIPMKSKSICGNHHWICLRLELMCKEYQR